MDHQGLPDSSWNSFGPRLLAPCCFFSFLFVILSSMSYVIFCRSLLGSILSSQADPPTLKNLDFASAGARFLKNQHVRSKDGLGCVLGLPWAPCGGPWGSIGGSLGPRDRQKGASRFVWDLLWASFARFLLPKMALGAFWGRLWLVLSAPEGLVCVWGGVSAKPILTIKMNLLSFDNLLLSYV